MLISAATRGRNAIEAIPGVSSVCNTPSYNEIKLSPSSGHVGDTMVPCRSNKKTARLQNGSYAVYVPTASALGDLTTQTKDCIYTAFKMTTAGSFVVMCDGPRHWALRIDGFEHEVVIVGGFEATKDTANSQCRGCTYWSHAKNNDPKSPTMSTSSNWYIKLAVCGRDEKITMKA